jgi:hypothetical protein
LAADTGHRAPSYQRALRDTLDLYPTPRSRPRTARPPADDEERPSPRPAEPARPSTSRPSAAPRYLSRGSSARRTPPAAGASGPPTDRPVTAPVPSPPPQQPFAPGMDPAPIRLPRLDETANELRPQTSPLVFRPARVPSVGGGLGAVVEVQAGTSNAARASPRSRLYHLGPPPTLLRGAVSTPPLPSPHRSRPPV